MLFLPKNGKLTRARVKKAEEGGPVERLKASLEALYAWPALGCAICIE